MKKVSRAEPVLAGSFCFCSLAIVVSTLLQLLKKLVNNFEQTRIFSKFKIKKKTDPSFEGGL